MEPDRRRFTPVRRSRRGRVLGGVAAGLAADGRTSVSRARLAFLLAALIGGAGIVVYAACWLIMPLDDESERPVGARGVVVLAQAAGLCVGIAALAVAAAAATAFGFAWWVFGIAAAVLVGMLRLRRLAPAWALLPVAAMALPAVAVAASGISLAPRGGRTVVRPASVAELRSATYRSGLDTMLIDLRRMSLPSAGFVPIRIHGGLRRTIVALPADRCVHVQVHEHVNPVPVRVAGVLSGRQDPAFSYVVLFGGLYGTDRSRNVAPASGAAYPGPTLLIDFNSEGGSLYVRDFPRSVDPDLDPNWPGFHVAPEPRPELAGSSKRARRRLLREWRRRRAADARSAARINPLIPGPCARWETAR